MGAHVLQPRARDRCGTGGVRVSAAASRGVRGGSRRLRDGVPHLWAGAVIRCPRRRTVRPGSRRRLGRDGRTRSPLAGDSERRGGAQGLGDGGRARRRTRPGGRRHSDAAPRLGVDLPRTGSRRARSPARSARRAGATCAGTCGPSVDPGQRGTPARRRRARGGALPGRATARRRLGDVSGRSGDRGDGDAAHGDRRRAAQADGRSARCRAWRAG